MKVISARTQHALFLTATILFGSTPALADTISGQVVDESAVGVAGVNIDVEDMGTGDRVTVQNGGTNGSGFFNATVDPGLYRVIFAPPAPPTTTLLVQVVENVVVVGNANMGVIALDPGVALSGRVLNFSAVPVVGADLDVVDSSGQVLITPNDLTDGAGLFSVAAPFGMVDLEIDPSGLAGPLLAPEVIGLDLSADTNLGDVTLAQGFLVSFTVEDGGGDGVDNADIDAADSATGEKQLTPGDNTDNDGFVDFVVAAGTYDLEVCPRLEDRLVTTELQGVSVQANTDLGTVVLDSGVLLSGRVEAPSGAPLAGVDTDVELSSNGLDLVLCGDNTDSSGDYAIIVPADTYNVCFTPPYSLPFGTLEVLSVNVPGDTVLNVSLARCAARSVGAGVAGTGARIPQIAGGGGSLRLGNPNWSVDISNGRGGAQGFLDVAFGPIGPSFGAGSGPFSPLSAWVFVKHDLPFVLSGPAGAAGVGTFSLPLALPKDPVFAGMKIYARAEIIDPQAVGGVAKTPTLRGVLCH